MAVDLSKPRTANESELIVVEKYRALGYNCLKRGWPDFCFYNGDDIIFVEVKRTRQAGSPKKGLNSYQVKMIDILINLGLDVRVEYAGKPSQTKKNQKNIIRETRINDLNINCSRWNTLGVKIAALTEYQYRFTQKGHVIDYYPTSGKYFDITKNNWGEMPAYDFYKLFQNKK